MWRVPTAEFGWESPLTHSTGGGGKNLEATTVKRHTVAGFGWFTSGSYATPKKARRRPSVPESPYVIMERMKASRQAEAIKRGEAMEFSNCGE
jgi:hypothetical protein